MAEADFINALITVGNNSFQMPFWSICFVMMQFEHFEKTFQIPYSNCVFIFLYFLSWSCESKNLGSVMVFALFQMKLHYFWNVKFDFVSISAWDNSYIYEPAASDQFCISLYSNIKPPRNSIAKFPVGTFLYLIVERITLQFLKV